MIRQIQRDYPPYPSDVGIYYVNAQTQPQLHCHAAQIPKQICSSTQHMRPLEINVEHPKIGIAKVKGPKHPSILKNYKSCPVSPVHEEIDWLRINGSRSPNTSNEQQTNEYRKSLPKNRHSMYSDDAKTILDMIHADTEKMIAEITQKYGDLGVDASSLPIVKNTNTEKLQQDDNDEDANYSSDSLEDCSLDFDYRVKCQSNSQTKKTICTKKHRKNESHSSMPTRSVSDYFIYDEFYSNQNRYVSLSDLIDDDDADKHKPDNAFLSTKRHSSASFFLAPERKSQESLISDEMSYCNSMESILSDESECKSAPLEVLFTKTKRELNRYYNNDYKFDPQCTTSKSYGSSPNNGSSAFDYYMDQNCSYGFNEAYNIANYDCDSLFSNNTSAKNSNRCSPLPPPPEFQNITKSSIGIPNSCTFPSFTNPFYSHTKNDDFIPRFGTKHDQYSLQTNKSLSKEFATERQINNSNPLYACDDDADFFQRKTVKPAIPAKPSKLAIELNKATSSTNNEIGNSNAMKKSCSFEIEMFHNRGRMLQQKSAAKKYEQNLQKFEMDREKNRNRNENAQSGGTLEMPYVPHKPPVANRRTNSMKSKKNAKSKECINDEKILSTKEKPSAKEQRNMETKETDEKSIEIFIVGKRVCDDDNMDSLELYAKPDLYKEDSVDSLDEIASNNKCSESRSRRKSLSKNNQEENQTQNQSTVPADFLTQDDCVKFRDIEKKIDVVNKLVEFEERKMEQERSAKELRMRPFVCNVKEKGYVKSLTLNFDNLAKSIQYERELSLRLNDRNEIRRNYSLPDVLEVAKYRFDSDFKQRRQHSTENYLDGIGVVGVGL